MLLSPFPAGKKKLDTADGVHDVAGSERTRQLGAAIRERLPRFWSPPKLRLGEQPPATFPPHKHLSRCWGCTSCFRV
jgi:hypothetical protein